MTFREETLLSEVPPSNYFVSLCLRHFRGFFSWRGRPSRPFSRLVRCFQNYIDTRTLLGGNARRWGPRTPSRTTDANLDSGFVSNTLVWIVPKKCHFPNSPPLIVGSINTIFLNTQSRFASVVLDTVLGPPHQAQHTWGCPCFSVVLGNNAQGKWRALEGHYISSKALQGSGAETR